MKSKERDGTLLYRRKVLAACSAANSNRNSRRNLRSATAKDSKDPAKLTTPETTAATAAGSISVAQFINSPLIIRHSPDSRGFAAGIAAWATENLPRRKAKVDEAGEVRAASSVRAVEARMVTAFHDMAAADVVMWRASFDTADPLHLLVEAPDQCRHE